ncbi:glycosyltransferase family 1 protein [Aquitalea sp. ASV11]|uniref:glycosyltransferase family 4 protein n=1 Tax=Aquitalea sp. ASV11 TaxID=2795103 RepID=UPI0018ED998B|nr:glycosyltransferase family 1 protein [Aquitalea sp. ASV11]
MCIRDRKKYGIQDKVIHISGNDNLLQSLYQSAHAFIYPSLYEGFGLPPLEAMANNCPVISSNTSSMPEVIGNAGYYFNPSDINSIDMAINEVVYNSELRDKLIANGMIRLKEFTWEKCAQKTLQVYKHVLNE